MKEKNLSIKFAEYAQNCVHTKRSDVWYYLTPNGKWVTLKDLFDIFHETIDLRKL